MRHRTITRSPGGLRTPARAHTGAILLTAAAMALAGACSTQNGSSGSSDGGMRGGDRPRSSSDFNPVIARESWTFSGQDGWLLKTPNYRIFTTDDRTLVLDRVPAFLELAMAQYTDAIGDLPQPSGTSEDRLETYILASRSQWETLTRQLTGDRASTYLKLQAGGFAEDGQALLFNIGKNNTFNVAAHEGWHQYTQRVFEHPLPIWLEEGVAAYMEGFRWNPDAPSRPIFLPWSNVERFDRLRTLVSEDRITPLEDLLSSRPQDLISHYSNDDALDFYAQVWALVHFLNEGAGGEYSEELANMLEDAASGSFGRRLGLARGRKDTVAFFRGGRVGTLPFEVYFSKDLEEAGEQYERFVRHIVRTGARDRIVQGESPVDRP